MKYTVHSGLKFGSSNYPFNSLQFWLHLSQNGSLAAQWVVVFYIHFCIIAASTIFSRVMLETSNNTWTTFKIHTSWSCNWIVFLAFYYIIVLRMCVCLALGHHYLQSLPTPRHLKVSWAHLDGCIFLAHLSQLEDFHLSLDPYDTAWHSWPYSPSLSAHSGTHTCTWTLCTY